MAPAGKSTLDDPAFGNEKSARYASYLFLVLHCDQPLTGGVRLCLSDLESVSIGRGDERNARRDAGRRHLDVQLPDDFVSTQHAHLRRQGGAWLLEDAGSRNGCFIRGERVPQAVLRDGDLIEIGRTFLRYRETLPAGADIPTELDSQTLSPRAPGLVTLLPDLADALAALVPIACSQVPILLLGETGTGKEVLAHAIHTLSERSGPFVAVNCGALASSLLESQLFGHLKGAFTGASRDEPGYVRAAHGGTLFLDEIGDLPGSAQASLLRVLQEREVVPLGSTRPIKVDLRVVSATHRSLDEMVARGEFRSDLLARLSGYRHQLVPLRERPEDLGLLVGDLLRRPEVGGGRALRLNPATGRRLLEHGWPLNIRELQQCLAVSAALAREGTLELKHLPAGVREASPIEPVICKQSEDPEALRRTLIRLLAEHYGNVTNVARDLGKARMQVHRWMQRFGIDPGAFRSRRDTEED